MDKNKYYRNFFQYPAYHRKIHPELFDIGDAQDGIPGLQQCLHNQFGTLDLKRNIILGTTTDCFGVSSVTGGGPTYIVNFNDGFAYCDGDFTEVSGTGVSATVNQYIFVNSSGAFEVSSNMYDVDGSLLGQLTSSSVFTDMRNQRVLDTGVYYQYNAEYNIFRNKVDIKDDLKIYDIITCDASTPDIGETGTRFGHAYFTNLTLTNELTIGTDTLTEFTQDIIGSDVLGSLPIVVGYNDETGKTTIYHSNQPGEKHIPAGGTPYQFLRFDSLGIAKWETIDDTPVENELSAPITSNWAYVHENTTTIGIHGSTNTNTGNKIVHRASNGSFSAGIITATGLTISTKTRYLSLSGNDFHARYPDTDDIRYLDGTLFFTANTYVSAPVHIPHGATIIEAKVYGDDTGEDWYLFSSSRNGMSHFEVCKAKIGSLDTGNEVVDNLNYGYYFRTYSVAGKELWGAYVKYTITNPYP